MVRLTRRIDLRVLHHDVVIPIEHLIIRSEEDPEGDLLVVAHDLRDGEPGEEDLRGVRPDQRLVRQFHFLFTGNFRRLAASSSFVTRMTVSLSTVFSPKKRRSAAVGSFVWKRTLFAVTQT